MWETFRSKFKKHSVTRYCSDLSLFEWIVLVISNFLLILVLQPWISKVFSFNRTIFSLSRSEQFWWQNTILSLFSCHCGTHKESGSGQTKGWQRTSLFSTTFLLRGMAAYRDFFVSFVTIMCSKSFYCDSFFNEGGQFALSIPYSLLSTVISQ